MKRFLVISLLTAWVGLTGCCSLCPHPSTGELRPYIGPTEPMAKVVDDINANNSKVPTLWAHHYFVADVVDEKKVSRHASGDGVLLYQSPIDMLLRANSVVGTIFEIGSNRQTFWLKLGPEAGDTMWWGKYADFQKLSPAAATIPIRPDMVLDVLGIASINTNFNDLPVPIMRFDPYADAYIFIWSGKLPDRWVAMREVWYDRASKLPELVLLYDRNCRVVLRAEFNNPKLDVNGRPKLDRGFYRQVQVPGLAKDQWPWIPGNYNLIFPESGSHMTFTLDAAELKHRSGPLLIPVPASFHMPDPANADVNQVIQIGQEAVK